MTLAGCGGFGQVEQGLVISSSGDELTLILDSNPTGEAVFDRLPPVTVEIPQQPSQMGPTPDAGKLIDLDTTAKTATVFDPSAQKPLTIEFELVDRSGGVYPDDVRVQRADLPTIDHAAKTVTLYSPRTRELVTIAVPDQYLALPEDVWKAGDVVRYYFKDPGQALRMMNVSKTRVS